MAKTAKTDKIIFRVTPNDAEFYKLKAAELGYKNVSELATAALESFDGGQPNIVRLTHKLAAEMIRLQTKILSIEHKTPDQQATYNTISACLADLRKHELISESYLRDFEGIE